jgi:hypothetical protein
VEVEGQHRRRSRDGHAPANWGGLEIRWRRRWADECNTIRWVAAPYWAWGSAGVGIPVRHWEEILIPKSDASLKGSWCRLEGGE